MRFVRAIMGPVLWTSSEAALPKALEVMERFGCPKNIVSFVLPTGYSFNLDGTTLYLSVASVFVSQLAGVHMSFGQQIVMMLTLMLTTKASPVFHAHRSWCSPRRLRNSACLSRVRP